VPIPGLLSNVATFKRVSIPTNANQANVQPVYEVYASVQGRDLGGVAGEISKIVAELQKELKPGNTRRPTKRRSTQSPAPRRIGLLFAAVFVYLLMVEILVIHHGRLVARRYRGNRPRTRDRCSERGEMRASLLDFLKHHVGNTPSH
jgi:hypothetical protein